MRLLARSVGKRAAINYIASVPPSHRDNDRFLLLSVRSLSITFGVCDRNIAVTQTRTSGFSRRFLPNLSRNTRDRCVQLYRSSCSFRMEKEKSSDLLPRRKGVERRFVVKTRVCRRQERFEPKKSRDKNSTLVSSRLVCLSRSEI